MVDILKFTGVVPRRNLAKLSAVFGGMELTDDPKYRPGLVFVPTATRYTNDLKARAEPDVLTEDTLWTGYSPFKITLATWRSKDDGVIARVEEVDEPRSQFLDLTVEIDAHRAKEPYKFMPGIGWLLEPDSMEVRGGELALQISIIGLVHLNPPTFVVRQPDHEPVRIR